ncbi:MAG: type II toxin-antitoxin system HicA family toxin [bacterium]
MTKVPSLSYGEILHALQRAGWIMIRQKGSHIRMEKRTGDEFIKITVPTHHPVKRSTLAHIIKQAGMTVDEFIALLR